MTKNDLTPPKKTKGDTAHTAARALIGSVPYAGNALAEFFDALIAPPLEKRRDEWREQMAVALERVIQEVEGLTIESLQADDAFVSAVAQASQIAVRNHQGEKREALRNAVLNVAVGIDIDEDTQSMFLNMIDVLTPSHLRILKLFQAPETYANAKGVGLSHMSMGGHGQVIETVFPELRGKREFYDTLIRDLFSRGLTTVERTGVTMTGHGLIAKRTTQLGDEFLRFIAPPLEEK